MKKFISVFICLAIIFTLFASAAYAEEGEELKIAVASDLHYNKPREEISGDIDDPIYWYANRRAAMEDESGFIIDEFLKECKENDDVSYVLISGDIVDNRSIADHLIMAEKLRQFELESGKDVFVIDGNHDLGSFSENGDASVEDFKRIYADFGYDKAVDVDEETCSYAADLGAGYRLICLDSCDIHKSTEDGMNAKRLKWVNVQAEKAKADGKYPIVMMHHNLLDHMPLQRLINRNFIVRFHFTTAELFADWGIKAVFTGHEHCGDTTKYTSALGNTIYDFATTSLTMYPLAYRLVSFTDDKIDYSSKTIETIDFDALTGSVSGYTDDQLDLMKAGLNSYAKGFLKAGVQYRLELSLSMEKMGIKEDAFYYGLVNSVVGGLVSLLRMPLYGDDSVSSLAEKYNITLPQSDYKTGWDLATELVAAHYAGEEASNLDSPEVTILLRTLGLILHSLPAGISDYLFAQSAQALLEKLGMTDFAQDLRSLCTRTFGGIRPGEYFLIALISPFLYEFAYDSDGVNDNNGSIDGYGVVTAQTRVSNILSKGEYVIKKLLDYIKGFFYYISLIFNFVR